MDTNEIEMLGLLDDINNSIKSLQANRIEPSHVPGTFSMMFSGSSKPSAIQFIFDNKLDKYIDQLLDLIMSGKIDEALDKVKYVINDFDKIDIDANKIFTSEVSKNFIFALKKATESSKFQKTKNNVQKIMVTIKELKRKAKNINDPKIRKKYEDTVYAFNKVLKVIASVYKSRKHINDRVLAGINNFMEENYNAFNFKDDTLYKFPLVNYLNN